MHFVKYLTPQHNKIFDVFMKELSMGAYAFPNWLLAQGINPRYRNGNYAGCEFSSEQAFLAWILKHAD